MDEIQRQLRIAVILLLIIVPFGTAGFTFFEQEQGLTWLDGMYATIITLSTIGYGDVVPQSAGGRAFAVVLAIGGLSVFAFAGQAIIQLVTSPVLRTLRQRRRTIKEIALLRQHTIICGEGEMVDKTVDALLQVTTAPGSMKQQQTIPSRVLQWIGLETAHRLRDVVVITGDADYAEELRTSGLLVITGDATDNRVLQDGGLQRAQAMMVLLEEETETLLTVLTARSIAPDIRITAAVKDHDLSQKMVRVGANAVVQPYETAGQFLNNATLRPAVNDYFNRLLYDFSTDYRLLPLLIQASSAWEGRPIGDLRLRSEYETSAIGICYTDARYGYAPDDQHRLKAGEILIVVAPSHQVMPLITAAGLDIENPFVTHDAEWRASPQAAQALTTGKPYALIEAEEAAGQMAKHFIICGDDAVARSAIAQLDPARPFVIISSDNTLTSTLLKRGFRVVHGDPTKEETLRKAGIQRAQAIMVSLEKKTDSVLTVLSSRMLNRRLLITATANSDDMIAKLERAGADRVVSPYHVAAQFVLLTTRRPVLSGFVHAILYNRQTGLETTEIYIEDESVWIGKALRDLHLGRDYDAGVIGVRLADHQTFLFAPAPEYMVQEHDVLIIVTPMRHSDALREAAHGGTISRPTTLRSRVLQSGKWTPHQIEEMLDQARKRRDSES